MADNLNAPLFADRYRFEPVSDDWDHGRSGYTHLVYDLKENRLGVIKRIEANSKQSFDELKSEVKALKALKGLGVPEVYEVGQATYGSKNYDYMVIEYIDDSRVEKNLNSISAVERVEIITKLFGLLSQAHQKGIVNGDVDLKHLFWRKDKKHLIVIDWGNAKLDADPKKKTEFAYDLARAAEIVFSLVTRQGHPPATGSISLPPSSAIIDGLDSLPVELCNLCKWAPRTPSDGAQAPYTAQELHDFSKKWFAGIVDSTSQSEQRLVRQSVWVTFIVLLLIVSMGGVLLVRSLLSNFQAITPIISSTIISSEVPSIIPLATEEAPTETLLLTEIPAATPAVTPSPRKYSPIVIFDQKKELDNCWSNEVIPSPSIVLNDGFYQRDDKNWGFRVQDRHSIDDIVQVDFSQCFGKKQIGALALNVAVNRLEIPAYEPSREFGIFLENKNGQRREYTLWLDKGKIMYLRIRAENNAPKDYPILVVSSANIHISGQYPRLVRQFPILVFLEINNQGLDILYLLEGSLEKRVNAEDFIPSQMIRMDVAVLPTFGNIQKAGLVGRGGQTETQIWPLVFLEELSE